MKTTILVIAITLLSLAATPAAVEVEEIDGKKYFEVWASGDPAEKFDIVFIGDGFTKDNLKKFEEYVGKAYKALKERAPFSEMMCAFNIWRVNVISEQDGIDHPASGVNKDTALCCHFGNGRDTPVRWLGTASPSRCLEAANYAPDHQAVVVLVNEPGWGGSGDVQFAFSTLYESLFDKLFTHELGHHIGGLADEYPCKKCDGSDDNRTYTGPEPVAANVTKQSSFSAIKWNSLIIPGTTLPTTEDDDTTTGNTGTVNPLIVNTPTVGAWLGGNHYKYGIFRPQDDCHMRSYELPMFCKVCANELRGRLSSYCETP